MAKKAIAGCLALTILGGLAYYSSYLYSSREFQENSIRIQQEQDARRQEYLPEANEQKDQNIPETRETESAEGGAVSFENLQETATDLSAVQADTEEISYYLVEEFGYVNIYLSEYTDITIDSLPEELQLEICTGKGIASEQELYDFLENYSS